MSRRIGCCWNGCIRWRVRRSWNIGIRCGGRYCVGCRWHRGIRIGRRIAGTHIVLIVSTFGRAIFSKMPAQGMFIDFQRMRIAIPYDMANRHFMIFFIVVGIVIRGAILGETCLRTTCVANLLIGFKGDVTAATVFHDQHFAASQLQGAAANTLPVFQQAVGGGGSHIARPGIGHIENPYIGITVAAHLQGRAVH